MKTFKWNAMMLVLAVFAFFLNENTLIAQNWDASQQEVWKNVVAYNNLFSKGNVNEFMNYFDPSYSDWSYEHEKPGSKEDVRKSVSDFFNSGNKVTKYELTPLAINVYKDFAYVDYTITGTVINKDGKTSSDNERWTDILMKKNGKWMLIGDQGGQLSMLKMPDSTSTDAGNWSAPQQEILKAEYALNNTAKTNNVDAVLAFYDPTYTDWAYSRETPNNKEDLRKFFTDEMNKGNKFTQFQITPFDIKVYPDFAFIHYALSFTITDKDGNATNHNERWTDIWAKKQGKWMLIGDQGGSMPENK